MNTVIDTAKILNNCNILEGEFVDNCGKLNRALLDSTVSMRGGFSGSIKSNGQCAYSQNFTMMETDGENLIESINLKLKNLPQLPSQFTKTIFDRQQCAGMIQV